MRGGRIHLEWLNAGAIVLPVLLVLAGIIYYPLVAQEGGSIGLALFSLILAAPILMLILLLYVQPATWRYADNATIWEGSRDYPWRLALSVLLYGVPAACILCDTIYCLAGFAGLDVIFLIVEVPLLLWLLLLRAAMAAPRAARTAV
jgi:hypothetical protein